MTRTSTELSIKREQDTGGESGVEIYMSGSMLPMK